MSSWIIGLGLAALASVVALPYLWLVRRTETETEAGLRALAGLRWREFATLVAQAMQQRGLRDDGRLADDRGDGGNQMLMTDGGHARWLVACKHGMAYRIGAANLDELAAAMDLAGAERGILLTEGRAERDALAAAAQRGIELVDGRRLWPMLKPFLPAGTSGRIVEAATAQARRHSVIAVLGALALGLVVAVALPQFAGILAPADPPQPPAATAAPAPAPATATPPAPAADAPPVDPGIVADPDAATLARYQADIAHTVSRLPGITRAHWLTRATLVVDRVGSDKAIWPMICAELERYPSLRTVRVQLNPRPERDEPVRWRQCRTM